MPEPAVSRRVRFGPFELDPTTGELSSDGRRQTLPEQPLALLKALLARPGELVAREELQRQLWPGDTFVDFERGLNAAVKRLREAIHDSADEPRFIETIPRRGYRLIVPAESAEPAGNVHESAPALPAPPVGLRQRRRAWYAASLLVVAAGFAYAFGSNLYAPRVVAPDTSAPVHNLTRLTFGSGFETDPTWSPDGNYIAYASDRSGNLDIWIQPVAGGEPRQLTRDPEADTQPTWATDGSNMIVYRSERDGGGLFAVPAEGGPTRQLTTFGSGPRWAPDGSQVLFTSSNVPGGTAANVKFYSVRLDGAAPRRMSVNSSGLFSWTWYPNSQAVTLLRLAPNGWVISTVPLDGGSPSEHEIGGRCDCPYWAAEGGLIGWAQSGNAAFMGCLHPSGSGMDVWRFAVGRSSQTHAVEAITNGTIWAATIAVSPDSKRVAFSDRSMSVRVWAFPFDAVRAHLLGPGRPVTDIGGNADSSALSRDGKHLVYTFVRQGAADTQLERSEIDSGKSRGLPVANSQFAVWSPDSQRIAYEWTHPTPKGNEIALIASRADGSEPMPITSVQLVNAGRPFMCLWEWSSHRDELIGSSDIASEKGLHVALTRWSLRAAPRAEASATVIATDPRYNLWQGHVSPNGRWIVFEATRRDEDSAVIYVAREDQRDSHESDWTVISRAHEWADKPRWSPDGKLIYFVLSRGLFLDLWAVRFDPLSGKPIGDPFQISHFDAPALQLSPVIGGGEIGISRSRLTLTMAERKGSIWMADNVDK
jgi:Tol biopolymer transport system component/DNA-binding winged helix-turn-helix (wHTH) protein